MGKQRETLFSKIQNEELGHSPPKLDSWRYDPALRIAILVFSLLSCTAFFPNAVQDNENPLPDRWSIGSVWNEPTVIADRDFAIVKSAAQFERDKEAAKKNAPFVFIQSPEGAKEFQRKFLSSLKNGNPPVRENAGLATARNKINSLSQQEYKLWSETIESVIEQIEKEFQHKPYISSSIKELPGLYIIVRQNNFEDIVYEKDNINDSASTASLAKRYLQKRISNEIIDYSIGAAMEALTPNFLYSELFSRKEQHLAIESVPMSLGIVRSGETIIAHGARLTKDRRAKIESYYQLSTENNSTVVSILLVLGNLGHVLVILGISILYLFYIRPKIFNDNKQLAGLFLLQIIIAALGRLSIAWPSDFPLEFAVIIPSFAMLVAILFDSRTGFYTTLTMSLMLAGVRGNDFNIGLTMLSAGMLGAYTVRDVQSRTQIFRSIFFIFIGFFVPIASMYFTHIAEISTVLIKIAVAAFNSLLAPIVTFGLLWAVERIFNITTNLRLQEFDNLNHPLLLELSEKAPGTYQHTLTIARLAEAAAKAIGANTLLAKVGSYFHDVGKIAKSEYFIENQINIDNKHDRLTPKKSAAVIRDHIEDGIELARQYKLPERIVNFIPTHHGTLLIKHFYALALKDSINQQKDIDEDDFRYPGPKPNSEETAIVMLADAAEAISRIVENDEDLEIALTDMFHERILDGQFDECEITLAELQKTKEVFIRSLSGSRHQRIKYSELPSAADKNSI